jgi:hypothetical protein
MVAVTSVQLLEPEKTAFLLRSLKSCIFLLAYFLKVYVIVPLGSLYLSLTYDNYVILFHSPVKFALVLSTLTPESSVRHHQCN